MRISRGWWLVIAAAAVCAGILVFLFSLNREIRDQKLADGSVLHLEKAAYGKHEQLEIGGPLEKIKAKLPQTWVAKFFKPTSGGQSSWYQNTKMHTNDDALYIYFTRRDPSGDYQSVESHRAELLDENGFVFVETQAGGEDDGRLMGKPGLRMMGSGYSIVWFRFEAFPRRERKFRVRVYDNGGQKMLGEFTIVNPAPAPPANANWIVQNFPITSKEDDVSFTLAKLKIQINSPRDWPSTVKMTPTYEITEAGRKTTNWQALETELYDSSGNFASVIPDGHYLSPREVAWKMRVKFFASEQSHSASNTAWTLRGIQIPGPGQAVPLSSSQELQGVMARAIAFAGPGEFTYSNDVPVKAAPPTNGLTESTVGRNYTTYSRGNPVETTTIKARTPFFIAELGDPGEDQRFTVRATDERGRDYYARNLNFWNGKSKANSSEVNYLDKYYGGRRAFLSFDFPDDVKTVDITICVHTCRKPEFIFKPPQPDSAAKSK